MSPAASETRKPIDIIIQVVKALRLPALHQVPLDLNRPSDDYHLLCDYDWGVVRVGVDECLAVVVEVELLARNIPICVDDNDGCMVVLISWFD